MEGSVRYLKRNGRHVARCGLVKRVPCFKKNIIPWIGFGVFCLSFSFTFSVLQEAINDSVLRKISIRQKYLLFSICRKKDQIVAPLSKFLIRRKIMPHEFWEF